MKAIKKAPAPANRLKRPSQPMPAFVKSDDAYMRMAWSRSS